MQDAYAELDAWLEGCFEAGRGDMVHGELGVIAEMVSRIALIVPERTSSILLAQWCTSILLYQRHSSLWLDSHFQCKPS